MVKHQMMRGSIWVHVITIVNLLQGKTTPRSLLLGEGRSRYSATPLNRANYSGHSLEPHNYETMTLKETFFPLRGILCFCLEASTKTWLQFRSSSKIRVVSHPLVYSKSMYMSMHFCNREQPEKYTGYFVLSPRSFHKHLVAISRFK